MAHNIREIIEEEHEDSCHTEALAALVHVRSKLLRESWEARRRRAQVHGEWSNLSQEDCSWAASGKKAVFKVADRSTSARTLPNEGEVG